MAALDYVPASIICSVCGLIMFKEATAAGEWEGPSDEKVPGMCVLWRCGGGHRKSSIYTGKAKQGGE